MPGISKQIVVITDKRCKKWGVLWVVNSFLLLFLRVGVFHNVTDDVAMLSTLPPHVTSRYSR